MFFLASSLSSPSCMTFSQIAYRSLSQTTYRWIQNLATLGENLDKRPKPLKNSSGKTERYKLQFEQPIMSNKKINIIWNPAVGRDLLQMNKKHACFI